MPESEFFKLVLQGGSFGLLVVLFLWAIGWGIPMLRDEIRLSRSQSAEAVGKAVRDCAASVEKIVMEFRDERKEQRQYDREEWDKRDEVIEKLAKAVESMAYQIRGCPHHVDPPERRPLN